MINIGIIGVGYWGPNYVRIFNELQESNIYVCCDIDSKRLELVRMINSTIKITNNYTELLTDPQVDAVVVSTPASLHYRITKECLEAGKDVLVEKPMTLNTKEAEELIDIAKGAGKILMVGHTFEFNPGIQNIKEYMDRGDLGDIYYLHFSRTGLGPIRKDVNAMWDLAPHDISILLYLLNEMPVEVSATGQWYIQKGIEDVVFMYLKFPNNVIASVHTSWIDPYKIRKTTIVGSKKMLVFDDTENLERIKIFDKGVQTTGNVDSYGEFRLQLREGDIHIPRVEGGEPLKNEVSHFLKCVIDREVPRTDGKSGLRVVKVLDAAQKSLKNNMPMKIS